MKNVSRVLGVLMETIAVPSYVVQDTDIKCSIRRLISGFYVLCTCFSSSRDRGYVLNKVILPRSS